MNNKKIVVVLIACVACGAAFARPHFGGLGWHHRPIVHHYHHGGWGRGGCNFWPGFVGGLIGGAVSSAIVSTPTVVTTPVVVQPAPTVVQPTQVVVQPTPVTQTRNVWVEGRYVDQVQANGTVIRVWQPGHYEQTTVVVQ